MTFTQSKSGDWETTTTLAGQTVTLLLDSCFPAADRTQHARGVIEQINAHWNDIEQNLLRSLHMMYNDGWADPEDGFPELTATEFLSKLRLKLVTIMEEPDCLNVYFDDGELFGGHSIELYWTKEKMYDANIVG